MADDAPKTFLWLTEADVVSLINLSGVIEALEQGLKLEAEGKAKNLHKGQSVWQGGSLNVTGAQFTGAGFAGAKVWSNVGGKSAPLVLLHGSDDGQLKAIIEAVALGQMRTAALAAVATRWLAAEGADDLGLVGTGKQAITQVAAVHAVRPLKRLRVFSPTAENRARFAETVRGQFNFEVAEALSVEDAVRDAPIITTVTRAKEPFLFSDMVAPGSHINAAGAIIPAFAEIGEDIIARCDRVVVDNLDQCRELSRELQAFYDGGPGDWNDVEILCDVVAAGRPRTQELDLTLFKWMGVGLADLAAGIEIFRRAQDKGIGTAYPHPGRAAPDLG
ncbi:MAG: ornithine cyclodeaminase family protein [Alphaproteobacteria bacterium]|nr:ornithine cyclodeaminase family protein [Alphaproteobacteria bacterium]